ncbi:MAG: HlyD family efflux transporter periplasmic adaptor subunit [Pseudomonadota bacterium]
MNIRHECPHPDLSFLVTAPLYLQTPGGERVTVERWSLGELQLPDGEELAAEGYELIIPFQGVAVQFPISLEPLDKLQSYKFSGLTVRQRETLAVFYNGVLSGRMASTGEMITSLDTPVDLVPMEETEEEKAEGVAKAKPRILRTLWNMTFYVLLALFLVGFVGGQIWSRLSEITLDHARFVAPIIQYAAPEAGHVDRIYVEIGQVVKAGDPLIRLEDTDRESDVDEVRMEVRIAERRLKSAQQALDQHIRQRPLYREEFLQAFYVLWRPWSRHEPRAITYPPDIQRAWEALLRFDRGLDMRPGGYADQLIQMQDRLEAADLDYRRWKRELRLRKAAANEMVVRAKTDGTVFAIHTVKRNFVSRSDLVIEVEENNPRLAVGWLDDRMATSVYVGMEAEISYIFRGQPKSVVGEIVDLQAGVDSVQPDKFGMIVTIKADGMGLKKTRKWFRNNAPAEIELKRDWISRILPGADDEGA